MNREDPQKQKIEVTTAPEQKKEGEMPMEQTIKPLNDHLYEVWKAENPEEELIKKILRKEIPVDLYQEFQSVYSSLQEEDDDKKRLNVLAELRERGKISVALFEGLAGAIFREWSENMPKDTKTTEEPIKEEGKTDVKTTGKETATKPFSRKEDDERKRVKLIEFLQEADRLLADFKGYIPPKELQKIRGKLSSQGKDMRIYASSRIGSLLLKEAERKDATEEEQRESEERFLGHMEVLLGYKDRERLKAAYELYRMVLSRKETLKKIKPQLRSRFDDRPSFNLSNMEHLWDLALLVIDTDENLTKLEKGRILSLVAPIEDFLEKVGHDELKDKIKTAKQRRIEELELGPAVAEVIKIKGELARELTPERNLEKIKEQETEVKQRINLALDSLVRNGAAPIIDSPGYAKRIIADVILLSRIQDGLSDELRELSNGKEPAEQAKTGTAKYSQFYFDSLMRKKGAELETSEKELAAGEEDATPQTLRETISGIKKEENYLEKLRVALIAGFINEEDYNQFLIFNEAHAVVAELKAKNKEGDAATLADADKEGLLDVIRAKLSDAYKLYSEAEGIRRGNFEKPQSI